VLQFFELSENDRLAAPHLGNLVKSDQVEVRFKRDAGDDLTVSLPPRRRVARRNAAEPRFLLKIKN
jgi:hypothetical protein